MIEWFPEQSLRNKYILQIPSLLQESFPIDMEDEDFGAFVEWLINHSTYYWYSGKKLVDFLGFDYDTKIELHKLIDEWEQITFDEHAH